LLGIGMPNWKHGHPLGPGRRYSPSPPRLVSWPRPGCGNPISAIFKETRRGARLSTSPEDIGVSARFSAESIGLLPLLIRPLAPRQVADTWLDGGEQTWNRRERPGTSMGPPRAPRGPPTHPPPSTSPRRLTHPSCSHGVREEFLGRDDSQPFPLLGGVGGWLTTKRGARDRGHWRDRKAWRPPSAVGTGPVGVPPPPAQELIKLRAENNEQGSEDEPMHFLRT